MIYILPNDKGSTIEKKIAKEDFKMEKIYEILTELQNENMIDIPEKSLLDLTNESFVFINF